ncbi:putative transcriptional regulator, AsnC family [Arcticibacter svalbardensis MN12-7]|uniref:Putative transcriptional regulator, AsnC family n=1 Tax=Arcticibacter svalbardensis MN12-7 TaxID=1150600 RepID=R9GNI6_9SPHI|nr:Lrp/AsnC ligand binding domain-containing protein [Arcticibacter svalbardensis]EOR93278.1 putative transcriptional regulator, AsnC family [Arcticibacter svalbardensis MN12-7]
MSDTYILDEIDRNILEQLQMDAEKPYVQIAKSLNISNSLVHQRVSRLKQFQIIETTQVNLSEKGLGYESSAFTGIILKEDPTSKHIIEALKKIPEIVECYYISGQYTLFLKIVARNNEHLREILYEKIDAIPGILRTETTINFGTVFKRNCPVPDLKH